MSEDQGALFDKATAEPAPIVWVLGGSPADDRPAEPEPPRVGMFERRGDLIERFGGTITPRQRLLAQRAEMLLGVLHRGADRALDGERLAAELGLGSSSEIRRVVKFIRQERLAPVGSSRDGYYICADDDEIRATLEHLYGRRNAINEDIEGLEVWLAPAAVREGER